MTWTLAHTRARVALVNRLERQDSNRFQPNPLGPGYLTRSERYRELRWLLEARECPVYYVSDYGPEGSYVPANASEFETLDAARAEVARRLGDIESWRRWDGIADDNDIEAYHASSSLGCGGCAISKE